MPEIPRVSCRPGDLPDFFFLQNFGASAGMSLNFPELPLRKALVLVPPPPAHRQAASHLLHTHTFTVPVTV